jgi:hypothetical protein
MYAGAHSCPSNYEENIGRNAWALHRNYPYAGVTSSGIWLLLAGVVTTWYGQRFRCRVEADFATWR